MLHLWSDGINLRRMISQLHICMGFDCNLLNFNVYHKILMVKLFPKRPNFTSETLRLSEIMQNFLLSFWRFKMKFLVTALKMLLHGFCYVHMNF